VFGDLVEEVVGDFACGFGAAEVGGGDVVVECAFSGMFLLLCSVFSSYEFL
jgi:hypothetical protein